MPCQKKLNYDHQVASNMLFNRPANTVTSIKANCKLEIQENPKFPQLGEISFTLGKYLPLHK